MRIQIFALHKATENRVYMLNYPEKKCQSQYKKIVNLSVDMEGQKTKQKKKT